MEQIQNLGKRLNGIEQRDAIHIAIAPMEAAEVLEPGQRVGTDGHGRMIASEPHIGIVDPFLRGPLKAGERGWMMLFPGTITSLRHEWAHPALGAVATAPSNSEQWMRAWAVEHMGYDYYGESDDNKRSEEAAYASAIDAGHRVSVGPYESARDHIDNEWWAHWEAITGGRGQRGEYFSCSC